MDTPRAQLTQLANWVDKSCQIAYINIDESRLKIIGGGNMKNRDAFCDEFDKLNRELDGDDMSDEDTINIEEIENSIMNKLDSMIDAKLNKNRLDNEGTNEIRESIENPIEEDNTENESNTDL